MSQLTSLLLHKLLCKCLKGHILHLVSYNRLHRNLEMLIKQSRETVPVWSGSSASLWLSARATGTEMPRAIHSSSCGNKGLRSDLPALRLDRSVPPKGVAGSQAAQQF